MGPRKATKKTREQKELNWGKFQELCGKYNKAIFVEGDNVSSLQMTKIRAALRKIGAELIMGKNTLLKASLAKFLTKPVEGDFDYEARKDTFKERPELEKFNGLLRGNTGIIFSNGGLSAIKEVLDSESRGAPAKAGAIAPCDVWIRAGPTGLDPKQTSFFQTLNIQTKINKSQVEIVQDKIVISAGTKVEASQAALLDKLKITPFAYKMEVKSVYDNGKLVDPKVLDIKSDQLLASFQKAVANITCASLGSGYIIKPALPHLIGNAFKNMVGVTYETEFTFKQAEALKSAASTVTAGPAAGGAGAGKAAEAAKEEVKEEEADFAVGGMFGEEEY